MNNAKSHSGQPGVIEETMEEVRARAADSLESAADSVRTAGNQGASAISDLAYGAGAKLDSSAAYVRTFDGEDILGGLRHAVRRHPVGSLALATAVGLVAGFACRRIGSAR